MKRGKEEKKESSHKKTFVWKGLRISFWTMIGLYAVSLIFRIFFPNLNTLAISSSLTWILIIIGIIQTLSIFSTFVISIIHLTKYKQKAFAIIALVISSILVLALLLLFGSLTTAGA